MYLITFSLKSLVVTNLCSTFANVNKKQQHFKYF